MQHYIEGESDIDGSDDEQEEKTTQEEEEAHAVAVQEEEHAVEVQEEAHAVEVQEEAHAVLVQEEWECKLPPLLKVTDGSERRSAWRRAIALWWGLKLMQPIPSVVLKSMTIAAMQSD